jgi:hypothetical protein
MDGKNPVLRLFRKLVRVAEEGGPHFVVRRDGKLGPPPLGRAHRIETVDVTFAIDSIRPSSA